MTPSCWSIPSWSNCDQPSATFPSLKRVMITPVTVEYFPVAGIPGRSPRWVPVAVMRCTTKAPSAISCSILKRRSGTAFRYKEATCLNPSGPGAMGLFGSWFGAPGATFSSRALRFPLFQTSSSRRRAVALFCSVDMLLPFTVINRSARQAADLHSPLTAKRHGNAPFPEVTRAREVDADGSVHASPTRMEDLPRPVERRPEPEDLALEALLELRARWDAARQENGVATLQTLGLELGPHERYLSAVCTVHGRFHRLWRSSGMSDRPERIDCAGNWRIPCRRACVVDFAYPPAQPTA